MPNPIEREQVASRVRSDAAGPGAPAAWERPAFEVVSLACEISAYAPADGDPLF